MQATGNNQIHFEAPGRQTPDACAGIGGESTAALPSTLGPTQAPRHKPGAPCKSPAPPRRKHTRGPSGLAFHTGWQRDRRKLLARVFERVAKIQEAGGAVNPALRKAARRLAGRTWRDGRSRRLSFDTLRREFYRWLRSGRSDASLRLNYRPGTRPPMPKDCLTAFLHCACDGSATSMRDAWRKLTAARKDAPSYNRILRALSDRQSRALRQFHRAARAARRTITAPAA